MHRIFRWMQVLLTVVGTIVVNFSFAQGGEPVLIKVLDGVAGNFKVDSFVTVEDTKWWTPAQKATIDTTLPYKIRNVVTLKFYEESTKFIKSDFTDSVYVKIIYTNKNNNVDSIGRWFVINFDDSSGIKYDGQHYFTFNDGFRVTTRIDTIRTTFPAGVTAWDVMPHLRLENEMQISRFYNFSCASALTSLSQSTASIATRGDIRYTWSPVTGATEYDIEWTFIDSAMLAEGVLYGTVASPDRAKIFEAGSTRNTIYNGDFYLPLIYDNSSYLFVRARPVQVRPGNQRIEGSWYPATGVGYYFTGHETALNWQATTTFAEEGKRKTVVSYADGSLKQRQTVTRDNSLLANLPQVIASETLYDYQGRPAIQVLPSPKLGGIIKYIHGLNKSMAGGEYEKSLYDSLISPDDYCSTPAPPMIDTTGVNKYYSANNPYKSIVNLDKALPVANGYAFAETRYAQDNTGRIMAQGGVGQQYQIGSKHETKYYYGKPDSLELYALFGTEVGDPSHYQKNMVRDANGQYSVSYVDMKGRTIATALAGVPDPALVKLDTLDSYDSIQITKKLLDRSATVIDGLSMQNTTGLIVTKAGQHIFRYSLSPDNLSLLNCEDSTICYDCVYNLEIVISDECNNQTFIPGQTRVILDSNFTIGAFDTLCNAIPGFNISDTLDLKEGSYTISKKLTVSRPGYEYYRDSIFMIKNLCKTFEEFYAEELSVLQQNCEPPTCETCNEALGTLEDFTDSYAADNGIPTGQIEQYESQIQLAYNTAKTNCDLICDSLSENDGIREALLADMSPEGGQYATWAGSAYNKNIFHQVSEVGPQKYIFQQVSPSYYVDENGKRDSIYNSEGVLVPPDHFSITPAEFRAQFKTSWAEALLHKHPEYGRYLAMEELRLSNIWDKQFSQIETYAEAVAKGFLNPTYQTGLNHVPAGDTDLLRQDNITLFNELKAKAASYQNANDTMRSMWSLATATAHCNANQDICFTTYLQNSNAFDTTLCAGELDMAWRSFQQFYSTEKRKIISDWLDENYATDIPTELGYYEHYANLFDMAQGQGPGGTDTAVIAAAAQDSLDVVYGTNCEAYVETWLSQIATCNFPVDSLPIITARLVQVCKEGSDAAHPFGSSSVKPGSSYTYKSFDDVIKDWLNTHGGTYDANCNGFLITAPAPYEQPAAYADQPLWAKPDSCQCEKFDSLYQKFLAAPFSDSNFAGYVKRKLNVDMTEGELQTVLDMCSGIYTCKFLEQPIYIPPQLQCGFKNSCATCDSVVVWHDRFVDSFAVTPVFDGNDSLQSTTNLLYQRYMNYHSGLNRSYTDYLQMKMSCDSAAGDNTCDTLKQVLADFREYFYNTPSYWLAYNADGCDTISWRFAGSRALDTGWVKFKDMFVNGEVRTPDSVYSHVTSGIWSDSSLAKVYNLHYPRIICGVNNDFSWDVGVKHKLFDGANGAEGVLLNMKLYDEEGNITVIYVRLFQAQGGSIQVDTVIHPSSNLQVDFTKWSKVKVRVVDNFLKVFVDGEFRFEVDLGFEVVNAGHFTVIANRVDLTVDYLRIFDGSGGVILSEDFTNACESFAIQNPIYDCDKGYCNSAFVDFYNDARGTSLNESQIQALYVAHCGRAAQPCLAEDDYDDLKLCSDGAIFTKMAIPDQGPCADSSNLAFVLATEKYKMYKDSMLAAFDSLYLGKCMKAYQYEDFTVTAPQSEFHYTLYYYDQAGNLVKTIPPAGVDVSKFGHLESWKDSVAAALTSSQFLTPAHQLPTDYRYNTLNQVKAQKSPDGGSGKFWYDRLGRLVLSQNAKQLPGDWYSYTVYDSIGRIAEVGELHHENGPEVINDSITRDLSALNDLITSNTRRQITNTYYDVPYYGWAGSTYPLVAKNLRSRVSYTTYTESDTLANYNQGTFYSYDIHGNVDTLLQDYYIGQMKDQGQRFKKLVYQYDLISGKVNHVAYQANQPDQFYHRYVYDSENRVTQAQTSADSVIWERDALYSYYWHGPLGRTQLGQQKVQGVDYAYTLQGWLKAINGMPNKSNELGNDGAVTFANQYTGIDAYSIQLHYNSNDYTAILNTCYCVANTLTLPATHNVKNLYNGNIAGMSVSIPKLNKYPVANPTTHFGSMYYNYKYDQLNRLKEMDTYTRMLVSSNAIIYSTALSDYKERIKYDGNGNILKYQRHGNVYSSVTGAANLPLTMDSLEYKYYAGTNQLRQVRDSVNDASYADDIDNQADTSNYLYDPIGNIVKDKHEGIDTILWNVYGKISEIQKTTDTIRYAYDAGGNRISKMVWNNSHDTTVTWYARDATGNVMSVYKIHKDSVWQDELHLYGSSRIGILKPERNLNFGSPYRDSSGTLSLVGAWKANVARRGMKFFELSNHLGNVLVTISDKKLGVDANTDGNVEYYNPDVVSANDYYSFGMVMPGRKFSAGNAYRYGFNGKENDNEVKGKGNQQDYGMRIYDPRLGKFLSVDPITKDYPELTPYQFASNTPIQAVDIDGLEAGLSLGGGSPYSEKKTPNMAIAEWLNSPATDLDKRGLINQINLTQSQETNLKVSDFDGLTKGGYYLRTFFISRIGQNSPGRLNIPNTRRTVQPQTPKASAASTTSKTKIVAANSTSVETVTVTRVQTQHNLSQRVSVNESGDVSITGNTKLYITIDDKNHVNYYYNKKGGSEGGASVVSFQVNKDVADEIRKMAVPQAKAKTYPDRPEIADPTKSKSAYGLPANYIKKLEEGAIKGSGKVETP